MDFILEYWRILLTVYILTSLFGIYWFELAWKGIERVRKGQEECW